MVEGMKNVPLTGKEREREIQKFNSPLRNIVNVDRRETGK